MGCHHQIHPFQGSGIPVEERAEKLQEPEVMGHTKATMHFKYTHELTTVRQHTQGLHKFKPSVVPELRREVDTNSPAVTQKISPTDTLSQMKNEFSSRESHWVHKPLFKVGPMPSRLSGRSLW